MQIASFTSIFSYIFSKYELINSILAFHIYTTTFLHFLLEKSTFFTHVIYPFATLGELPPYLINFYLPSLLP